MKIDALTENRFMDTPEMTDEDFARLEDEIKITMKRLQNLQKQYRRQTGKDYNPFT